MFGSHSTRACEAQTANNVSVDGGTEKSTSCDAVPLAGVPEP